MFDRILAFAGEIGLVPIPIHKEQPGYIINSLIVPWCTAALGLLVSGVSDVESIDWTWMITMRSGMGPFGMMDLMGSASSIMSRRWSTSRRPMDEATLDTLTNDSFRRVASES